MLSNHPTLRQQAEALPDAQHDGAQDMERGPVCPVCGERMERDYWDHNAGPWECEACGTKEEA